MKTGTLTRAGASSGASRSDRDVFLILIALYGLILVPILRANRYYNDDLKRALIGRTGWDSNGRPLTTLLMKLLQFYDHALIDISPFTQIGAVAILAWAGVLIARRYAIRSPLVAALVAFPLGAQPFFLENLSYKFDSLSMALALFLALLPAVALRDPRRGWWLGVAALFASLCLYQPAFTAFLIFVLVELVLAQLEGAPLRQLARRFVSRVVLAAVAMLVYELLVGIHVNGWVRRRSETIHHWSEVSRIGTNLADFQAFIGGSFNQQWWMYYAPVLLLLAVVPMIAGVRYALLHGAQPVWMRALLLTTSVLVPVAAMVGVVGPMLPLANPPIAPRVLVGVGALLAAALIVLQAALRQWNWSQRWSMAVAGMLALGMCVVASAYGNALGEQKSYEDRIAARLADDLAELKGAHPVDSMLLAGTAGYAPLTAHAAGQIPLITAMIPPYIAAADTFHTHLFLQYTITDFSAMDLKSGTETSQLAARLLTQACDLPVTRSASGYTLYLIDDVVVVMFGADRQEVCAGALASGAEAIPTQYWTRNAPDKRRAER
jgi:hypothetical protein